MMRRLPWLLLAVASLAAAEQPSKEELERRREAAVARCEAQRGVDCRTEEGLRTWLLQERSREEAIEQGSRSIRQRVDRLEPEKK